MKNMFVLLLIVVATINAFSQNVREDRMNVLDAERFALNIEIGQESKIVEDAWNQKTSELKIKGKTNKGLLAYEGIKLLDIHFEAIDLYVKIEKIDKVRSNFTIAISKGAGNFIGDEDKKIVDNAKRFLIDFSAYCDQYKLKLDIKELEDQIKKAQKEQEKLVDEGKKLEKQLEKNKVDQENKTKEIQTLQSSLEQLRTKLK
jgi:hypothetical protein